MHGGAYHFIRVLGKYLEKWYEKKGNRFVRVSTI